jgi:hypothetical protein
MCKFSFGMFVSLQLVGYPYIFGDAACQPIDRARNIAQERARNPVFHRPVIGKARGPNGNFGRTRPAILILPPALAGTHHGRALKVESSPLWKRISPSSDPSF